MTKRHLAHGIVDVRGCNTGRPRIHSSLESRESQVVASHTENEVRADSCAANLGAGLEEWAVVGDLVVVPFLECENPAAHPGHNSPEGHYHGAERQRSLLLSPLWAGNSDRRSAA